MIRTRSGFLMATCFPLATGLCFLACGGQAFAAAINRAAFGPTAVVDNFATLAFGAAATPLVRNGRTYTTSATRFDVQPISSTASRSLNTFSTMGGNWYIDVALSTPTLKAGLLIGAGATYQGTVTFFDAASNTLGTVSIPFTPGGDLRFAGWQTTGAPITRMRAAATPFTSTRITEVITQVPEPTTLALGVAALGAVIFRRRR